MAPTAGEPGRDLRPGLHGVADSLLSRIAARDPEAFEILYRRYARPVYGLALPRLGDRGRAEDATQEAFAAVWRSAESYVPARGRGARWLFAVARSTIVDHARRAGRAKLLPAPEPPEVASHESGPGAVADEGWSAFRVHAAVAELPEPERVPLELAYWGGRSKGEIADLLDLPLGTVETRTRSALARLALRLEECR